MHVNCVEVFSSLFVISRLLLHVALKCTIRQLESLQITFESRSSATLITTLCTALVQHLDAICNFSSGLQFTLAKIVVNLRLNEPDSSGNIYISMQGENAENSN